MDIQMDRQMNIWMDGQMYGWKDKIDGQKDRWIARQMDI